MKVLIIGSDPQLFVDTSEARMRAKQYAARFDEYHVISMQKERRERHRDGPLFLYSTNSRVSALRVLAAYRLGKKIIRHHKVHVIDAQDAGESGLVAFFLAKKFHVPFRVQIHTDVMSVRYRRGSWKELVRFWIARFLIPRASCIRVVSERIKRSLISFFQFPISRISVLPIFTDVRKFLDAVPDPNTKERLKGRDFKIIAVGRFVDKEKNFSMLLSVMKEFVKICPRALLALVGEGPDKNNYQLLVTGYGLEENVIIGREEEVKKRLFTSAERTNYNWQRGKNENSDFHSDRVNQLYQREQRYIERSEDRIEGWRNDLPAFYKSFDLFVHPANYEGWGRAVIEAMAAGLPVLMTDVGVAGEIVQSGENGMVVPPGDKQRFFKELTDLYYQPKKRQTLAANGKKTAELLGQKTWEQYLDEYKKALRCGVTTT